MGNIPSGDVLHCNDSEQITATAVAGTTETGTVRDATYQNNPSESPPDRQKEAGDKFTTAATNSPNPRVTIQALGSSGPSILEDFPATTNYYGVVRGGYTNILEGNLSTFGLALGGTNSRDVLATSLAKDLNKSNIGGQTVGIQRLWPGSGRMMRSYRLRVRVDRMDSQNETNFTVASISATPATDHLPFTIELVGKSFIVRSESGENSLRTVLAEGDAELKRLRGILSDPTAHPNILSYSRWVIGPLSYLATPSSTTSNTVTRSIHLLRQHAYTSLSDRLVSRPFLTMIEKNWITYQLLNALQSLHNAGVCHGHITTENVLLTSWNWVLISDIGCQHYKPVTLPDDDPGLWIHWFEGRGGDERKSSLDGIADTHHHSVSNGEKKCCLAPERFYTAGKTTEIPSKLTPAMDVFSLGCVLIELFLSGERALDLGDIMEYRRQGENSDSRFTQCLKQKLDKIESSKMRAACRHMLSLDPSSRLSPVEYLEKLSSNSSKSKNGETLGDLKTIDKIRPTIHTASAYTPIPACFRSTVFPFMLRLRTEILSPDARIALLACNYSSILKATVGVDDDWGATFMRRMLGHTICHLENCDLAEPVKNINRCIVDGECQSSKGRLSNGSLEDLFQETEDLLKQIDSGVFLLGEQQNPYQKVFSPKIRESLSFFDQIPKPIDSSRHSTPSQSSLVLFLQVLFSSLRHVRYSTSKFVALKLIHRIAYFSFDDIRLQRIVPFVTSLLQDPEPIVRASAISVLVSVLSQVTSFPPSDAQIFPRYIFKKVAHLITDASLIVRVAFAKNIALLSETSLRFLDVGHSVSLYDLVSSRGSRESYVVRDKRGETTTPIFLEETAELLGKRSFSDDCTTRPSSLIDSTTPMIKNTYDSDLAVLQEVVLRWVVHITTDTSEHSSQSKQALLHDLARLCNFFGVEYSFQILPQILAFLNDRKDWQLRASLCRNLSCVCVAVGRAATEQFVIPCIESALNDDVGEVVSEAVNCLSALVSLSLLTRTTLLGSEGGSSSVAEGRLRRDKQGVIKKCATLLVHPLSIVRKNSAAFIYMCWQALGETDSVAFVSQLLKPYLQYHPHFDSLPQLVSCLKRPKKCSGMNDVGPTSQATRSSIMKDIEFSSKLSCTLTVPSQKVLESAPPSLPLWYESLQNVAAKYPKLSHPHFSLEIQGLQQVYGINIPLPTTVFNPTPISSINEKELLLRFEDMNVSHDEEVISLLSRPKAQILESACKGAWGSSTIMDHSTEENFFFISKIQALNVPPLAPSLGHIRSGYDVDIKMMKHWMPKEDKFLCGTSTTTEHLGPVHRLALSEDQAFFVSASWDGTSRVFELDQIQDSGGELHSSLTYNGHKVANESPSHVRINDVAILEHSHSVATAASDGSLHVWKIDTVSSHQGSSSTPLKRSRVSGTSVVRQVNRNEGELMAVSHFNTSSASILAYATLRGVIHSLDLRCPNEPFILKLSPEYGYLTSIQVGNDKNWIVAGTNRGYIGLWDIRFQEMVKLWRHSRNSPVKRLTTASYNTSRPLLYMGCDNNEALLFDASSSNGCLQCCRVLDSSLSFVDRTALPLECLSMPYLENVEILSLRKRPQVSLDYALNMSMKSSSALCINALVGNVSHDNDGPAHLMTGGSDGAIRYWNLDNVSNSFCISGLLRNQQPPSFEKIDTGIASRLLICRQPNTLPSKILESNMLPLYNRQGVLNCENRHIDSILDLKVIAKPSMCVLSSSRDGTIKLWA